MYVACGISSEHNALFFDRVETLLPKLIRVFIVADLKIQLELSLCSNVFSQSRAEQFAEGLFSTKSGQAAGHRSGKFDALRRDFGKVGELERRDPVHKIKTTKIAKFTKKLKNLRALRALRG